MTIATHPTIEHEIPMPAQSSNTTRTEYTIVTEQLDAFYAQVRGEFLEVSAYYLNIPDNLRSPGHHHSHNIS